MNLKQIRFLTDENISPKVVAYLRERGADVLDVKECGWQGKTDHEILGNALIEKRVCLTCDKDFGTLKKLLNFLATSLLIPLLPEGSFIAAITQRIPEKSFQMVRYYGWYSNKC
ncbi:MAG: DUF5615 family PIN-like protein [Candidatus Brocadiaceae bacterium]|nr:DUF5615 family PIN-like protein [Candidatus Brocadiaceae bacterium]